MRLRLVMFLVIAPLFATIGYLTLTEIAAKRQDARSAGTARALVQEGATLGALVHELQRERGFSAGFIAAGGATFRAELAEQRRATDKTLVDVKTGVPLLRTERAAKFSQVQDRLDRLAGMRRQVDDISLDVPGMAAFYTGTIALLLEIDHPLHSGTARDTATALQNARTLVGAAKEAAGLERAMGATGLGRGFSAPVHTRFLRLNGAQEALLSEASGTLQDADWLDSIRQTESFDAIRSARAQILQGIETGAFGGLTAPRWFAISSDWIDLLRKEELALVQAVAELSATSETAAAKTLRKFTLFGTVLGLLVLAFAVFSFERMIARITSLTAVINRFTGGDFTVSVEGTDGRDELGRMASAISRFMQDTLDMRRNAEALKADQERIKAEQDQVVTAIDRASRVRGDCNNVSITPFRRNTKPFGKTSTPPSPV
ncbi:MAG: nitrate- and nitrite sensing domain-containing protein [Roseovarius sp.]